MGLARHIWSHLVTFPFESLSFLPQGGAGGAVGREPTVRVKRGYTRGISQPRASRENIPGARANRGAPHLRGRHGLLPLSPLPVLVHRVKDDAADVQIQTHPHRVRGHQDVEAARCAVVEELRLRHSVTQS
eukprot:1116438-Prorocentrum_minimum.AAC.1